MAKKIEIPGSSGKKERCVLCGEPTEYYYVHKYRTLETVSRMQELGVPADTPLCPGCIDRNVIKDFGQLLGFVQKFHDQANSPYPMSASEIGRQLDDALVINGIVNVKRNDTPLKRAS